MDIVLHQNKFHQVVMKRFFITPLIPKNQTIRKLLCYYQELACKDYPTESKLEEILGNLYDAKFQVNTTTFGTFSILEYSLTAVDPALLNDESYTMEKLENCFEKFLKPKMGRATADLELFHRAYEILESDLFSLKEDQMMYSHSRAISTYFKNTNRDFFPYGSLTELKKITPKQLYEYYQDVMKEEAISILTGKLNLEGQGKASLAPKQNYFFKDRSCKISLKRENSENTQSYLQIIYETSTYSNDALYYPMLCLNYLLGGSDSSLLFNIVREKYGLCYSIHSTYYAATGILMISAALDPKDEEKGMMAIEEAIQSLENFKFDLEPIQNHFVSSILLGEDYIDTAIYNYLYDTYFLDTPKTTEELKHIMKVKKEDIISAYHRIKKSFTYILGGKSHE